jgi:hypothetical protein
LERNKERNKREAALCSSLKQFYRFHKRQKKQKVASQRQEDRKNPSGSATGKQTETLFFFKRQEGSLS